VEEPTKVKPSRAPEALRRANSVPGGAARSGDSPARLGVDEGLGFRLNTGARLCKTLDTNSRERPFCAVRPVSPISPSLRLTDRWDDMVFQLKDGAALLVRRHVEKWCRDSNLSRGEVLLLERC
jgi:hypothetical protein